jgi:hypothetical protein
LWLTIERISSISGRAWCAAQRRLFSTATPAAKAKPGLLIVYHSSISWWPRTPPSGNQFLLISTGEFDSTPDVLQRELGSRYSGHFVIGRDLDVY